jgi:hypothetical protein
METASTSGDKQGSARHGGRVSISQLEAQFRKVTELLYDTRVPAHVLDEQLAPFLAEDIVFVDPWQTGGGRDTYQRGAKGFHCMLRFDFDITQLNIQLDEEALKGRALVDGIMNLKQFSWLYTYPLRTILVYDFTLERRADGSFQPLIHFHEEMWSLGDMIAAVPGVGWVYKTLFRPAFSVGFLAASERCRRRNA